MLVDGFLIRRSLLHERRKLIKILHYQHYVFLELYGLCVLERRLELTVLCTGASATPQHVRKACSKHDTKPLLTLSVACSEPSDLPT